MLTNSGVGLTDIGANLTDGAFKDDVEAVIERAVSAGVERILVTGTSVENSARAIALAVRQPDRLFATVGVHPHQARDWDAESRVRVSELARQAQVVAIGETGLDFNRDYSPRPKQEYAFQQQLELASTLALPVFVHERDTCGRLARILETHRKGLRGGVVHCFTGTREDLDAYLEMDLYVGVTGWICDERRGQALRQLAPSIPLERLLVETDAPYLLPRDLEPKPRNRRNEPATLPHIVRALARCMGLDERTVAEHSSRNAAALFGLPGS